MQQVHLSDLSIEEMLYFDEDADIDDFKRDELIKKPSITLLLKRSSENLPNAIDDVVAQMVYGNQRAPPGDDNSPYQKLLLKKDDIEIAGIWTPPNSLCKAMALKWFFPNVSGPYKLPEEKLVAPHYLVGYDAFKYKEVLELSKQYPDSVAKYGFFTVDIPGEGRLLTKTADKFEKRLSPPTYDEKIVIQLAKNDDWLPEFMELGPSYMSPDTVKGGEDAKIFFPATYDIPEDVILEIKKKPKKKIRSKFVAVVEAHEDQITKIDKSASTEPITESQNTAVEQISSDGRDSTDERGEHEGDEDELGEGEEGGEGEGEGEREDGVEEIDKATSPMEEEKIESAGSHTE